MYVFLIYLLLFIAVLLNCYNKFNNKIVFFIFWVVLLFILIRYNIGPDSAQYLFMYNRVTNPIRDTFSYNGNRNFGFTLLQFLVKTIFNNYSIFIFIVNLIVISLVAYVILKYSINPLASLLLFVGSGYLEVYYSSGLRQSIAMAIFLFGFYKYMPSKQYSRYILICIFASLFHEATLITLVVPLIDKYLPFIEKKWKKLVLYAFIFVIIFNIAISYIGPWLYKTIGSSSPFLQLLIYLSNESFSIMGLGLQVVLTGIILCLWNFADKDKISDITKLEVLVTIFSFFLYIAFARYSIISRMCDLLQVVFIVAIPNLLSCISFKKKKVCVFSIIAILNAYLLYSDLNFKIGKISKHSTFENMNIINYPYFTVFDKNAIQYYLEGISVE